MHSFLEPQATHLTWIKTQRQKGYIHVDSGSSCTKQNIVNIRIHDNTHSRTPFQDRFYYIHRQRFGWWWLTHIHTPIPLPTLDSLTKHTFLRHAYRSNLPYTHAALHATFIIISQVWGSSVNTTVFLYGRIADCTVRHPGVERPFFSFCLMHR